MYSYKYHKHTHEKCSHVINQQKEQPIKYVAIIMLHAAVRYTYQCLYAFEACYTLYYNIFMDE